MDGADASPKLTMKVDGGEVGVFVLQRRRAAAGRPAGALGRLQINLGRGTHTLTIAASESVADLNRITIQQKLEQVSPEKRALHYRLFGMESGSGRSSHAKLLDKSWRTYCRKR